ncbi:MAG TPA: hypothetical protein VFU13_10915, partial [Steroidobacteraceae bacterium]|nr:hypothetical protein [Steroidobacteraceae bacterium]
NLHLAWSAVGGLAVGLAALRGGKLVRRWGAGLLTYVALDHASWNAVIAAGSTTQRVLELWLFTTLRDLLGFLPIAALVVAWWFDRHQQRDYARNRIRGKRLPAWTPDIWLAQMRSPVVLFGLVLMTPSILWFVGGWPQTSSLQTLMTASVFWILVLMLSLANQSWTAWRVFEHGRSWPKTLRLAKGDDIAFSGLRLACGAGAVGLAGYALVRSFSGLAPQGDLFDFHVLEAVSHLRNVAALMFGGIALAFVGPSVGEAAGVAEEVGVVEAASVGEAAAVGGLAAGGAIAAGAAAGVLVGPAAGYVIEHAEELRNLPDADEVSPVAGAPPDSKPDGGTPYRVPTPPVPNPDVDPEPYFPGPGEPGWPGNPPEEPKTPPPPPTEPVPPKPAEPKTFPDRPGRKDPSPFHDPEKKDP